MVTIFCGEKKFTEIKGIIFDKDGTLSDSQKYLRELAIKRTRIIDAQIPGIGEPLLMAFGVEANTIDNTGLMAVGSRMENEIVTAGYIAETGRGWFESLQIARKAFLEADKVVSERASMSSLFPGSLKVLQNLHKAGIKLGILSADTTEGVENFVKFNQLSPYIHLNMGVDDNITKPDPRLFLEACDRLGVEPQNTLMIGDSLGDMQMGKAAGAAGVIGISWYQSSMNNLPSADITISQLNQIKVVSNE